MTKKSRARIQQDTSGETQIKRLRADNVRLTGEKAKLVTAHKKLIDMHNDLVNKWNRLVKQVNAHNASLLESVDKGARVDDGESRVYPTAHEEVATYEQ